MLLKGEVVRRFRHKASEEATALAITTATHFSTPFTFTSPNDRRRPFPKRNLSLSMRHLPWWNVKCLANDTTELAILPMTTKSPRAMWMNQKTREAFLAIFRSMIYRCVSTRATLPKTQHESSLKILAVGSEIYNSDDFHREKAPRAHTISRDFRAPNLKKN